MQATWRQERWTRFLGTLFAATNQDEAATALASALSVALSLHCPAAPVTPPRDVDAADCSGRC